MLAALFFWSCSSNNLVVPSDAFLVDVRTKKEFDSGSVPNAVNIPLQELNSKLSEFEGKENIIVFCRSGNRSGKAKKILDQNGFQNVTNGGSWKNVLSKIEENEVSSNPK